MQAFANDELHDVFDFEHLQTHVRAGVSVGGGSSAADTDADLESQHRSVDGSEAAAVLGWSTEVSVTWGAAGSRHAPLTALLTPALPRAQAWVDSLHVLSCTVSAH